MRVRQRDRTVPGVGSSPATRTVVASEASAMPPRNGAGAVLAAAPHEEPEDGGGREQAGRRAVAHRGLPSGPCPGAAYAKASAAPSMRPTRWVSVP